jgi:cytochrome c
MKKIIRGFIFGLLALSISSATLAADTDKGTKEGSEKIVRDAIAYHKANGKDKTIAQANGPDNPFKKGVMYIFAYDGTGHALIHPNQKMVGKPLIDMKDAKGVPLIQEMIKTGNSKEGHGWIAYSWPNSATKAVEAKSSYVELYDGVYYACGYYL